MTEHHEHETVVVERDRGSGLGTILAIVLLIALLAAGWWFLIGPGSGGRSTTPGTGDTNTTTPSEVVPSEAPASS